MFTVHDADAAALERVRQGLDHASGYFRQAIARRLRMKVAPAVKFEVDKVFEQAERVEQILREEAAAQPAPASGEAAHEGSGEAAPEASDNASDEASDEASDGDGDDDRGDR